jgi:FKBP-type peptidyl-prolyl cis-trans isomerase SlyD
MIENGSKVKFHYTLRVEGDVVDSSEGRSPLAYVHGQGQIIPGLEAELEGLDEGSKKQVDILPEHAYGAHDPDAVQEIPKSAFTEFEDLSVGDRVGGQAGGKPFQATVSEIGDAHVKLDMNHPLAGKTLEFEVEVVSVE